MGCDYELICTNIAVLPQLHELYASIKSLRKYFSVYFTKMRQMVAQEW